MISNSSPLIILGKLNRLDILEKLFRKVEIAESVYEEVVVMGMKLNKAESFIIKDMIEKDLISIENLNKLGQEKSLFLQKTHQALEKGEADSIALAIQKKQKYVLIDEMMARKVAIIHGLKLIGILGVLLLAYRKKAISEDEIEKLADDIALSDFRIGSDVLSEFWRVFEEVKGKRK